jgi:hypothetical protein
MRHYPMLQQNLVYKGLTRGKCLVALVSARRLLDRKTLDASEYRQCAGRS